MREMLRRGQTLPGVEEAAVGSIESVPLNHSRNLNQAIFDGRDFRGSEPPLVEASFVARIFPSARYPAGPRPFIH